MADAEGEVSAEEEEKEEEIKKEEKKEEIKEEIKEPEVEDDSVFSQLTKFRFGEKVLSKKRKRTKERKHLKDDVADALYHITYNKLTKYDDIKGYLQDHLSNFSSDDNVKFIQEVIRSKIYNTNININDILGGRCFNVYVGSFGFKATSYVFTADNLYWIAHMYEQLKTEKNNIIKIVNMKEKYVNIQAINRDNLSYNKGYINDHSKDFSIIGFECFNDETQKSIKDGKIPNGAEKGNFGIKNVNYNYFLYKSGACIVLKAKDPDEDVTNNLKDYMNDYNVIGSKKIKGDDSGIKLYEIGTNKNIYISQKIKLTDYWPCEVVFTKPLVYSVLYKFDVDMIAYEKMILEKFVDKEEDKILDLQKFFIFTNIIDFSNFTLMINFLTVEILGNLDKKFPNLKNKYLEFIGEWKNYRNSFNIIKKNVTFFLKLFDSFFCSFKDKISYRVFSRINKLMIKRMNEFQLSFNEKTKEGKNIYENFALFLVKYKLSNVACTILNACNRINAIMTVAKSIAALARDVANLNAEKLYDRMKAIGHSIFEMYINSDGSNSHLINEIRTPSLFLGDLLAVKSKVAKGIIEEYDAEAKEKIKYSGTKVDELAKFSTIKDADGKKYAIGMYFKDKGETDVFNVSGIICNLKGEYKNWYDTVKDDITATNPIVVYGKSLLVGGDMAKDVSSASSAKDDLEKYYKSFIAWKEYESKKTEEERAKEKKEKALAKIEKKTKRKKDKDKDESKSKVGSETASTTIEIEFDVNKLSPEEKKNYEKLIEAKISDEKILAMFKRNKEFLKNDTLVEGLVTTIATE